MLEAQDSMLSSYNSTASLDSLFLRFDATQTNSITPVASNQHHVLHAKDVCDLLLKFLEKTMVMLVGLPASGKSTVCKQLAEYLREKGYKLLIYNAGNIRRMVKQSFSDSEFFNPENREATNQREMYATMSLENMLDDFRHNRISVGFLDATNTTRARRSRMLSLVQNSGVDFANVMVLDISCTDEKLLNYNITSKAFNVDYNGRNVLESISDFQKRTQHYFKVYEPVSEQELEEYGEVQYVSLRNGGASFETRGNFENGVARLFEKFTQNYYGYYGRVYLAAVEEFYTASEQSHMY